MSAGLAYNVLFYHRASDIVGAEMKPFSADVEPLGKPGDLYVRYVIQVEPCDGQPSEVFVAGYSVGEAFSDRRIVGLERPRDERDESRLQVLELAKAVQMNQAVVASFSIAEHHGGGGWNSVGMRYPHDIE